MNAVLAALQAVQSLAMKLLAVAALLMVFVSGGRFAQHEWMHCAIDLTVALLLASLASDHRSRRPV